MPKLSVCCFIKDNIEGAFCLFESMATLMPLADEYVILDLGSTDGTLEILKEMASRNPKIRLEQGEFPVNPKTDRVDAGSFAVIPNELVKICRNDWVFYHQADEIWHEDLIARLRKNLETRLFHPAGLAFWRYQLKENFTAIKWFPHVVHRIGPKENFRFGGDGMNSVNMFEPPVCSNFDGGWFSKWGSVYENHPTLLPTHEMVLDVSSIGGFLENIVEKRRKHAPFWGESPDIINLPGEVNANLAQWYERESKNPNWTRTESPFVIPKIMHGLLGKTRYTVRPEVLDAIARG